MATTLKHKALLKAFIENNKTGHKKSARSLLIQAGYAPSVADNPKVVLESPGFQQLLGQIDDTKIIKRWYQWALGDSDKRVALEAGREILTLKNRYPDKNLRIGKLIDDVRDLVD